MSTLDSKAVWPGWKTVRLIGRGSFGAVYEIERDVFGTVEKAALKVISIPQNEGDLEELYDSGYDDASVTETFNSHLRSIVNEYTLMREMNGSANVVNCDDFRYIEHDDSIGWDILIKMELLTPLTKAFSKDMPEENVIDVAKGICSALVLCRKYDIIHRDIKPQNIFVSKNGDYKLGDFGIAKTIEKTSGGTKIGTYKYMAPEVYNNQPYTYTSDIYSLGLVLHWLLNERRAPFMPLPPQPAVATMEESARLRRFGGEPIPAPVHGSDELKAIVLKACEFDPKKRYQSAQEMLDDLNRLSEGTFAAVVPSGGKAAAGVGAAGAAAVVGAAGDSADSDAMTTGLFSSEDRTVSGANAPEEDGTVSLVGERKEEKKAAEAAAAAALAAEEATRKQAEVEALKKAEEEKAKQAEEARRKAEAAASAAAAKQTAEEPKKKKKWPIILVALLAVIGIVAAILMSMTVTVPDLRNYEKAVAEQKLQSKGFKNITFKYEKDAAVAKGKVIRTYPSAGERLGKDKLGSITVYISSGDGTANIPDLSGKTIDQIKQLISDAGLKCEIEEVYDDKVPGGTLISQDPAAGANVNEGTIVNIRISKGPSPASMHTVTFNANGGSVSEASRKVKEDAEYGDLPTPSRNGYTFTGWYTAKSGGSKISSSTIMGKTDTTVYAQWSATAKTYTLSLNANGGSVSESSRKVVEGTAYGTLPTPTRTGYTFSGWFTAKSGGTKVSSTTKMGKANATIYAQWTANTYTLSFNANGGSVSENSRKVTYGKTYGKLPTPTRTDYTFDGWYTAASGGTRISDSTPVGTANTTVYAHWTKVDPTWSSWSSWSQTAVTASSTRQVQTETRWRYRDKSFTTRTTTPLSGWTQYDATTSTTYGSWSSWSEGSLTRQSISDSTVKEEKLVPMFRYYAYICSKCLSRYPYCNITCSHCGATITSGMWNEYWVDKSYASNRSGDYDSKKSYADYYVFGPGVRCYFSKGNLNATAVGTKDSDSSSVVIKQGYSYRTRTKTTTTTYYYWQWGSWSSWSTTQYTASDNRQVESTTFYRYRDRTN